MEPLVASEGCIYQEAKVIDRHIQSLKLGELIDYAIFIDGPYPGYPGPNNSDDGTREIIESYDRTILVTCPAPEYFKRELACHICRRIGCQFILILDGDEYLIKQNAILFRHKLEQIISSGDDHNIFGININYGSWDQFYDKPRLWYKPWEVEYIRGSHWRFKNMLHDKYYDKSIHMDRWFEVVEGLAIKEDSLSRGKEREAIWDRHQRHVVIPTENSLGFK